VSLVAIAFRDFGFRMLPTWIKPFQEEFAARPAMKVYQVRPAASALPGWGRAFVCATESFGGGGGMYSFCLRHQAIRCAPPLSWLRFRAGAPGYRPTLHRETDQRMEEWPRGLNLFVCCAQVAFEDKTWMKVGATSTTGV
jgi:hypothetical protein